MANIIDVAQEKQFRRSIRKHKKQNQENLENIRKVYDNSAMARFISLKMTPKRQKPQTSNGKILPNIRYRLNLKDYALDGIKQYSHRPTQNEYSHSQQPFFQNKSPALSTDRSDRRGRYFIFKSTDQKIKQILQRQGWIENKSKNSNQFSLKWVDVETPSDFLYLRENQYYNHIKNFSELMSMESLVRNLRTCQFYPRTYDLAKQNKQFIKNFDQCALMILLKKHIEYFKIKVKHLVDLPLDVNIVDILKFSKFTQMRNPHFLINIPLVIQACLYYEQLLFDMGVIKSSEIQIKLDPRNIQSLVNYSKINPPYDEYQTFKYSYIEEFGGGIRNEIKQKQTINFSRDFQRYSGSKTLDTPTDELISLLVKYSRILHNKMQDYAAIGNLNTWILINKEQSEKRERIINTKNFSGIPNIQNYFIQKVIQKPLKIIKISEDKVLKATTFVLLVIKEDCKIYFLNKHIARLQKKPREVAHNILLSQESSFVDTEDMQLICEMLHINHFYKNFQNRMKQIVLQTLKLDFLDEKKNCFEIIKFNTVIDQEYKIWLESANQTTQILKEYRDEEISFGIGSQLLSIILDINYSRRTYYKYWTYISKKIPSKEEELHNYGSLVKNSLLQTIKNKLSYYNAIRRIAYRYAEKVEKSLLTTFRQFIKKVEQRQVQNRLDICLASSILERIFKKRLKLFMEKLQARKDAFLIQ